MPKDVVNDNDEMSGLFIIDNFFINILSWILVKIN